MRRNLWLCLLLALSLPGLLHAQDPTQDPTPAPAPLDALTVLAGETSGTLEAGQSMHLYAFAGLAGDVVTLSATTQDDALDPLLIVTKPDGTLIGWDDDSGEGLNAALTLTLPADGAYLVLVGSIYSLYLAGDEDARSGDYTLTLSGASAYDITWTADGLGIPLLNPDEPYSIPLDAASPLQWAALQVQDSITLDIRASSPEADPLLYVFDANGVRIALDDDGDDDTTRDAFIPTLPLNEPGTYLLMVGGFDYHRAMTRGLSAGLVAVDISRTEIAEDDDTNK